MMQHPSSTDSHEETSPAAPPDWGQVWREWLCDRLEERGWKAADLARASGISAGRISNWMTSSSRPTMASCKAVAFGLNIDEGLALQAAGYQIMRQLTPDEAWQICFDGKVPGEARKFLRTVYRAWRISRPQS